ncbi:MAG TPA: cytochrome c-type biogenesis CcmF C-terminal domain-containing protein, partial [Ktedonobacteraceae bacterium]|nr:cytochrome c-type biogenesis CcmF C-terminal domain-containing protein [Ktedonobacteraceae bacterium]
QDATLKPGQDMNIGGYQLTFLGNFYENGPGTQTVNAIVQVWHDGQLQGYIYPGRTYYQNFANQPASHISIQTFGLTDLYVYLNDWSGTTQVTLNVFVNPLVPLVWLGGIIMLFGGIVCWWPERRKATRKRSATIVETPPASVQPKEVPV